MLINTYIIIICIKLLLVIMTRQEKISLLSLEKMSETIRQMRRSQGISQKELSRRCGLSQSTIARVETDPVRLNPSYMSLFGIMEALSSPASDHGLEMLSKTAGQMMHKKVIYVRPGSPISEAISLFKEYDFQLIPVLDNLRRVVGTVYQKDLLGLATQQPDIAGKRDVSTVMKAGLPQIDKNSELTSFKPLLEVSGAVIVAEKGRAVGIITIYDIIKQI